MVDEDILGGDGETDGGAEIAASAVIADPADDALADNVDASCLSCGAPNAGVFCFNCGQKNDDLRRSIFLLARDFVEDTFSFDSRMWRTLGILAISPGIVPTRYAHGKRSRFTPPVRLFLVVSFLFFLSMGFTQTLFVAIEITAPKNQPEPPELAQVQEVVDKVIADKDAVDTDDVVAINCDMHAGLRFLVRATEIDNDLERWSKCAAQVRDIAEKELETAQTTPDPGGGSVMDAESAAFSKQILGRVTAGVTAAIEDPSAFNGAFNRWLPRVLFLMTPVLALILGIFIRGRDALFFDHMVLSLYHHAVGFAVVALMIFGTQLGIPGVGPIAFIGLFIYFILSLKNAYGRGWVKTIYTAVMASLLYQFFLVLAVALITVKIIL